MSSINLTITHNEVAHNADVSDQAPYSVHGWFIDKVDGLLVAAERDGIAPVQLVAEVLRDLNTQAAKLEVEVPYQEPVLFDQEEML